MGFRLTVVQKKHTEEANSPVTHQVSCMIMLEQNQNNLKLSFTL